MTSKVSSPRRYTPYVELTGKTIVLYDGVCGLCNRLVRFLLRFDRHDRLRFGPLQSDFAASLLSKHCINSVDLDSISVITGYGLPTERAFTKSDAVLRASWDLGGVWRVAEIGRLIPRAARDWFYDRVARNRYRVFGKYEACPMPRPQDRGKFLG
jgi:predicted DCC family thiol-disulfide oxidoreductase YuxK